MKAKHFVAMQLLFALQKKAEGKETSRHFRAERNLRRGAAQRGCDVMFSFYSPVNKDTESRQLTRPTDVTMPPKLCHGGGSKSQRKCQVKIVKLIDEAIRTTGGGNPVARQKKALKIKTPEKGGAGERVSGEGLPEMKKNDGPKSQRGRWLPIAVETLCQADK